MTGLERSWRAKGDSWSDADDESMVEAFALDDIFLVHPKAGLRGSSINIFVSGGNKVEFINVEKDFARGFARGLKLRGDLFAAEFNLLSARDQLDLVEANYDIGFITKQEFADRKQQILGSLPAW